MNFEQLIENASTLQSNFEKRYAYISSEAKEMPNVAKWLENIADHKDYIDLGKRLLSKTHAEAQEALSEAMRRFPKLTPTASIEDALNALTTDYLNPLTEKLNRACGSLFPPGKMVENVSRKSKSIGLFSNLVEMQKKWLKGKSNTTKLTIGNIEILLGSVLALQGIGWVLHSLRGEKVVSTPHTDEKGNTTQTFSIAPMSAADKLLKATLGIGGIVAGIGTTYLGFSAFSTKKL